MNEVRWRGRTVVLPKRPAIWGRCEKMVMPGAGRYEHASRYLRSQARASALVGTLPTHLIWPSMTTAGVENTPKLAIF